MMRRTFLGSLFASLAGFSARSLWGLRDVKPKPKPLGTGDPFVPGPHHIPGRIITVDNDCTGQTWLDTRDVAGYDIDRDKVPGGHLAVLVSAENRTEKAFTGAMPVIVEYPRNGTFPNGAKARMYLMFPEGPVEIMQGMDIMKRVRYSKPEHTPLAENILLDPLSRLH